MPIKIIILFWEKKDTFSIIGIVLEKRWIENGIESNLFSLIDAMIILSAILKTGFDLTLFLFKKLINDLSDSIFNSFNAMFALLEYGLFGLWMKFIYGEISLKIKYQIMLLI